MVREVVYLQAVAALDAQWDRLVIALADLDPAAPSRVPGWTVRDVEAHLTATTWSLVEAVDREPPGFPVTGVDAWAAALPELAADIDASARSTEADLWPAVVAARERLPHQSPRRAVRQRTGAHTVHDAVRFRLVEAVVHGWDLGVEPDKVAERFAAKALAEALAARVPGRSVELRIPPYVAVQLVDGPVHTRGTPPNTVEMGARTWLDLATGRTAWADEVASGAVRARGDRADLSAWLPVLT